MQKFVIASAVLATAALAEDVTVYCNSTNNISTCDAKDGRTFAAVTTTTVFTPAVPNLVKFTLAAEKACADIVLADVADDACLTTIGALTAATADEVACIDATQGTNAACAVAKDGKCSTVKDAELVCVEGFECTGEVDAQTCTEKVAPVEKVKYAVTGFKADNAEDLQKELNEVFVAAAPAPEPAPAQEEPVVNACEGVTVEIDATAVFYKDLATILASAAIPAACAEQVKDTFVVAAPTPAQTACAIKCGDAACLCEEGMECVVTPAPEPAPAPTSTEAAASNCAEGLECVEKDGKFTCNSSTVATAALAVAAAVLAVMF